MNAAHNPPRVALIGLMGSGKTRLGEVLARRLGWPFVDADARLEAHAGRPVAEVFAREGESAFRDRESAVLRDLAEQPGPLVVATGGGVVEREENRSVLTAAFRVVWLEIASGEAARRVGRSHTRPLLHREGSSARAILAELAARRDPLYRTCAELVVRTTRSTRREDLCERIVEALHLAD